MHQESLPGEKIPLTEGISLPDYRRKVIKEEVDEGMKISRQPPPPSTMKKSLPRSVPPPSTRQRLSSDVQVYTGESPVIINPSIEIRQMLASYT